MLSCRWLGIPSASEQQISAPSSPAYSRISGPLESWEGLLERKPVFQVFLLKRKAYRNDPSVVVLVKLSDRDLQASAKTEVKPLRDWKSTYDKAGR
jgi:hypothetical protein